MLFTSTSHFKKLLILGTVTFFACQGAFSQSKKTSALFEDPALVKTYQQLITPEALSQKLYVIASDSLEGRGTGEPGEKKAAHYIASFYQALHLPSIGGSPRTATGAVSDYFQPFQLYQGAPIKATLDVYTGGVKRMNSIFSLEKTDDLSYYLSGGVANASGQVVFAGYGIADDTLHYNDFTALRSKHISIKDKWLLIFANEPAATPGQSLLPTPGHRLSDWSRSFTHKQMAIWRTGERPLGILVIMDAGPENNSSFAQEARKATEAITGTHQLYLLEPSADLIQTYAVSTKMADQLLKASGHSVKELKNAIEKSMEPIVFEIPKAMVKATVTKKPPIQAVNIFAFLEGSDPQLKQEVVVLSAHYDHLGRDTSLVGDQIYNGAADDGSGTAAVMEMAKVYTKAKEQGYGPRRSILFALFSGEERGKLGSLFFTNRQPLVPLHRIVAVINMDGVGGLDRKHPTQSGNYVYISGEKGFSEELITINAKAREAIASQVELTDAPPGFSSDHESFRDYHIPFIYYSTGKTEHYHQVTDEPHTVDYGHMAQVTQLIFAASWQMANQDQPIRKRNVTLKQVGYRCAPCGLNCDKEVFKQRGLCPQCRMLIVPRFIEQEVNKAEVSAK